MRKRPGKSSGGKDPPTPPSKPTSSFLSQELGVSELLGELSFFRLPCIIRQECVVHFLYKVNIEVLLKLILKIRNQALVCTLSKKSEIHVYTIMLCLINLSINNFKCIDLKYSSTTNW